MYFVKGYKTLTKTQIKYVNRIVDECAASKSHVDMMNRLVSIADDIIVEVTLCNTPGCVDADTYRYCQERFSNCKSEIPDGCSKCLEYCLAQEVWPPYSTHKCS